MKNITKKELLEVLSDIPDDCEISFYADGRIMYYDGYHCDDEMYMSTDKKNAKYTHIYLLSDKFGKFPEN
jgi:hypothetical protein